MSTVELRNISKSYDGLPVIDNINMTIQASEFIVIVGPSGCGKSTLLRIVAGLEDITHGEILINEKVINKLEPKDRDIAMVFQNYALYPHMTVFQNMAYSLKIKGMDKKTILQKVGVAAEMLHLEKYLDRKPRQLSGGQRQRVAMGRAIVREPSVFLFDEPLSNLDAKLRVQMRLQIRKLQKRLKVTSLYVTHDQVEAMTMADRLIVLNGGVTEQIGTPMDIYNDPESQFVGSFIGSPAMNFIPVKLLGGKIHLTDSIVLPYPTPLTREGDAILGIRPEHFTQPHDDTAYLTLIIDIIEPLGSETLVHGHIVGLQDDIVVKIPGHPCLTPNTKLELGILPDKLYLFDSKTTKRIR